MACLNQFIVFLQFRSLKQSPVSLYLSTLERSAVIFVSKSSLIYLSLIKISFNAVILLGYCGGDILVSQQDKIGVCIALLLWLLQSSRETQTTMVWFAYLLSINLTRLSVVSRNQIASFRLETGAQKSHLFDDTANTISSFASKRLTDRPGSVLFMINRLSQAALFESLDSSMLIIRFLLSRSFGSLIQNYSLSHQTRLQLINCGLVIAFFQDMPSSISKCFLLTQSSILTLVVFLASLDMFETDIGAFQHSIYISIELFVPFSLCQLDLHMASQLTPPTFAFPNSQTILQAAEFGVKHFQKNRPKLFYRIVFNLIV